LSKLKSYKIHYSINKWIRKFISHKKQRVRVDGEFSCWANVFSGIPQGPISGLLLLNNVQNSHKPKRPQRNQNDYNESLKWPQTATYQNDHNKNSHINSEVKMYLVSEQERNAICPFHGRLLNTAQT